MPKQSNINEQPKNIEDLSLSLVIERFLNRELALYSPNTRTWYSSRLSLFTQKMSDRNMSEIQEHHIWSWYTELQDRASADALREDKISVHTQHGYIRAVKRFLKWSFRQGYITSDFGTDLKLPRLPRGGKKGINDEDVITLINAASKKTMRAIELYCFFSKVQAVAEAE